MFLKYCENVIVAQNELMYFRSTEVFMPLRPILKNKDIDFGQFAVIFTLTIFFYD